MMFSMKRRAVATATLTCAFLLAGPPWARAAAPIVDVVVTPSAFSPDGDGVKDSTTIRVALDTPATLTLVVTDGSAATVRTLAGEGPEAAGTSDFDWNGHDDGDIRVADGAYTVTATADDGAGGVSLASAEVTVDTKAPRFSWRSIHPEPVMTNRPVHLAFTAHDADDVLDITLVVFDHAGEIGRVDGITRRTGDASVDWSPRYKNGGPVLQGLYEGRITLVDDAGNKAVSSLRAFRDHRPGKTRVVHRLAGTGPRVALTFDECSDGGAWGRILRVLDDRNAEASFFCLGANIGRFKAQARRTVANGHTIGCHSWNHALETQLSYAEIKRQAVASQRIWWKVAHVTPAPYFRPPYGAYDASVLNAVGDAGYARTMIWDVDPQDWTRPGSGAIADRVMANARAGSIVVMHTLPQTATALGSIISRLRSKGLEPVSLSELFSQAGARVADYEPAGREYE